MDGEALGVAFAPRARELLAALLLVVAPLDVLQLAGQSLDLELVLVHLRLVHVELRRHRLHLPRLLAQVLLVDGQLLRHLRPGLPRKDVLELHVQLLLLL